MNARETVAWNGKGIQLKVFGDPAPKGSPKIQTRVGRDRPLPRGACLSCRSLPFPRVLPDSRGLEVWVRAVLVVAEIAVKVDARPTFPRGTPLGADLHYYFGRPKTVKRAWYSTKPDLDKLVRATLDPLHKILFDDDSQIGVISASKAYAEADGFVGCLLEIWPLDAAGEGKNKR